MVQHKSAPIHTSTATEFTDFQTRFTLLAAKHPQLIINTLSNIFTMRLIGNKTHGDLAEVGIAEFIHQFMYDFDSRHVGKDLYRAKEHEEDIVIINEFRMLRFRSVSKLTVMALCSFQQTRTL